MVHACIHTHIPLLTPAHECRCVEHLRDNKLPPMTFLPLDTISAMPPDERLRMIPGAKLALDVIDYDKSVEKAMWYVTGNAVIVPTLDEAKKLAFSQNSPVRCKLVTMDACIISKSGAITGGDTTQLTNKAQRWQQKDSSQLKEKFEVCDTRVFHKRTFHVGQ
jgi:structural maintenance of chromosome 1